MREETSGEVDGAELEELVEGLLHDLGGAFGIGLVRMGGNLGLYRALDENEPLTARSLAEKTRCNERYVREWLGYQAASGYVDYDELTETFTMSPHQASVLAREDSPTFMLSAFDAAAGYLGNQSQVERAFRSGGGVAWSDQTGCLFCAIAEFFRPGYEAHLVDDWLPSLDGVVEKLERGAKVADVGCGHGISTQIMARAFPRSTFVGFDFHPESIAAAREHAQQGHPLANLRFEVADARQFPGSDYDLVTCFDCLHDMGDPAGACAHIQRSLRPDGTLMIVEPLAGDRLEDNLNPVGRLYYAASTMVCVPTSLSQEVGTALGAQAGEKRLREIVVDQAGFRELRRAHETPFNLILEARPQ